MDTKKLRQKILDLAIRGKLVPQDPNDEPASVLLERIRAEKERLIKEGKIKRSKKSTSDTPHYENIDFDVPSSWEIITLSEVFFMHAGKSISAADISPEPNEEYRYLCVGGNGKRGYVSSYNTVGAHPIIGRQGALCGNVNYTDGQVYATEHAVVVDTFCETEAWWAYYFLKQLNLNQYATATAQPGLSVNTIGDVQIPLPPYEEQVRIVAAIEQWYSLIDALETAKEDLQTSITLAKSKILDLAIHGKLVPQDPNDEPAIELLKRINPSFVPCDNGHDTNKLPSGWEKAKLKEICQIIMGSSPSGENINSNKNGVEFHQGKLFFTDLYLNTSNTYTDSVTKLAPKNSILLCVRAPVGIVNISSRSVCIGRGLCAIVPQDEMNLMFLFYAIQSLKPFYEENATGTTFKAIGGDIVRESFILLPPPNEQLRIVAKIEEIFAVLDEIQKSIED